MRIALVVIAIGVFVVAGAAEARKRRGSDSREAHKESTVRRNDKAAAERLREADRRSAAQLAELKTTKELVVAEEPPLPFHQEDDGEVPAGLRRR